MQRWAASCLLVSWGMCTCPMSIEDSAGADARRRMLMHTMHDVSGSLRATWPAFGVIVTHPNEWVHDGVQKAQSGHGNVVTSGKPGLGDEPAVQAGQPGAQMYLKVRIHPWGHGTREMRPGWRTGARQ